MKLTKKDIAVAIHASHLLAESAVKAL